MPDQDRSVSTPGLMRCGEDTSTDAPPGSSTRYKVVPPRYERSRTTPVDVAAAVHHALTTEKPRMRYVVGRPASLVILLRRYLPAGLFERVYFGSFLRRIERRAATAGAP